MHLFLEYARVLLHVRCRFGPAITLQYDVL
jgi:hypothetical protein